MIIIISVFTFFALIFLLFKLLKTVRNRRASFRKRKNQLMAKINLESKKQLDLQEKIKLASEFDKNYKSYNATISQSIYESNVKMLEIITKEK